MTQETFDKITEKLTQFRKGIVDAKRPEYTEGSRDILYNFKTVAAELGIDPVTVWYIFFRKHVASIGQFCKSGASSEPIQARIGDAMNYLELLQGLLCEKHNAESL